MNEPVPLLCYLTDGEDYIILPTNLINGNKLSTWITCPEYKLNRATEYQITVVYSTDAIDAMLRYMIIILKIINFTIFYTYLIIIITTAKMLRLLNNVH